MFYRLCNTDIHIARWSAMFFFFFFLIEKQLFDTHDIRGKVGRPINLYNYTNVISYTYQIQDLRK